MPAAHHPAENPVQRPNPSRGPVRPEVGTARRVVIKLGTRVLVDDEGELVRSRLAAVVRGAETLVREERQPILVSSGAVGLGWHLLGLEDVPDSPAERRACAAAGQSFLAGRYQRAFARAELTSAQVLVTEEDFAHRRRYLDLRETLDALLEHGAVPVLNENDAVTHHGTMERIRPGTSIFADNDRLAALVAAKCHADLLVLLTDVEGVHDRDPRRHPGSRLLTRIDDPATVLDDLDSSPGSGMSRGGMRSKVEAARMAARGGCHVVIASGREAETLELVLAGHEVGTWFPALGSLPARRKWIAFAAPSRGVLHLDAGAVDALRERRASLLPVGVRAVEGRFERGDVVELRGPAGDLVGRGLMTWDSDETRLWCGGVPPQGPRTANCLLRRTQVVLER